VRPHPNGNKLGWWCVPVISVIAGSTIYDDVLKATLGKKINPISKITRENRCGSNVRLLA
jgi:hypothetical protein